MMDEQRTDEWFAARLGCVTASMIYAVMAKPSTETYQDYLATIAIERMTQKRAEAYVNSHMQRGTDLEPFARMEYEIEQCTSVIETGFIHHSSIQFAGASPDGLVGDDGLIEIKCPTPKTHFRTVTHGAINPKYMHQMQWQMACTGREWCDFVSYDPDFKPKPIYCKRVYRDSEIILNMEAKVIQFLQEVDEQIELVTAA